MTVKEARTKFEELKREVLADGKIEMEEVDELLKFVEGYIVNDKFLHFKNTLLKCKADGKITDEESKEIISEIEFLSKFLAVETVIEKIIITAFTFGLIWVLVKSYFFT